jgi:hypothetical protein
MQKTSDWDVARIHKDLSPAQEAELKFLRQRVDSRQEERFRQNPSPNANQNYFAAAEELDRYVRELRINGHWI